MGKRMLLITAVLIVAIVLVSGCGRPKAPSGGDPVEIPSEYRDLYDELESYIDKFDAKLNASDKDLIMATELISANGNTGEALLSQKNLEGNKLMLDRFKSMGIEGVKITITYPLLSPDFPNSHEYLDAYRKIVTEAKKRNMKVLVGLGFIFADPAISPLDVDYTGYTFEKFKLDRKEYAQLVIDELAPDYLTIMNEPTTAYAELAIPELNSPVKIGEFTTYVIDGLDRKGTLVGAGAGTWESPEYIREEAKADIDYIDLHMYPLQRGFFERTDEFVNIARSSNKRIIIGETWLYKIRETELGKVGAVSTEMFSRDTFSFFAPLDIKYAQMMKRYAQKNDIEFMSFFWSKYFFAYLPYEQNRNLDPGALLSKSSSEAAKNIVGNKLTLLGEAVKDLTK